MFILALIGAFFAGMLFVVVIAALSMPAPKRKTQDAPKFGFTRTPGAHTTKRSGKFGFIQGGS